jgi:hypothetical protein
MRSRRPSAKFSTIPHPPRPHPQSQRPLSNAITCLSGFNTETYFYKNSRPPESQPSPGSNNFPCEHVKAFSQGAKPLTARVLVAETHKAKFSYTSWALHMQRWLKRCESPRGFLFYWLIAPRCMNFIVNFTSNPSHPSNVL